MNFPARGQEVKCLLRRAGGGERGFTLIELLVVIVVIAVLASLLLPVFSRSRAKAQGIFCLQNTKQLNVAWLLYADDHNGRLAYNLGGTAGERKIAQRTDQNWVNNIMDWEVRVNSDDTNTATITEASLGPYVNKATGIYRCPGDTVLSSDQRTAGWSARVRSYSMNAMVGNAGEASRSGSNVNNPDYLQFFNLSAIPKPTQIFVFLDEHPESIDDGYFINKAYYWEWIDLPASYHNGAASLSFADGHSEIHRWLFGSTKAPARPDDQLLPMDVPRNQRSDFNWVIRHMSVEQ